MGHQFRSDEVIIEEDAGDRGGRPQNKSQRRIKSKIRSKRCWENLNTQITLLILILILIFFGLPFPGFLLHTPPIVAVTTTLSPASVAE